MGQQNSRTPPYPVLDKSLVLLPYGDNLPVDGYCSTIQRKPKRKVIFDFFHGALVGCL